MIPHASSATVLYRGSRALAVVGLLATLLLVDDVQAQSIGEFLSDGSEDACVDPNPPEDTSGESNGDSNEGECYDWDYLLGLQCDNDFPPGSPPEDGEPGGEDPPGGETGGTGDTGDEGGEDTGGGGGVIVEDLECTDCEVIETPDGGVIIWVNDDEDDTGDTGAASSSPNVSDAASYIVRGRQLLQSDTGEHSVRMLLERLRSTQPTAKQYIFEIGQCDTRVRPLR